MKFSKANAKIESLSGVKSLQKYLRGTRKVFSFDLLSGWSCPYARQCLSKVHIVDGKRKIRDGKHTEFRCFSASQEALFPAVYNLRMANFQAMQSVAKQGPSAVADALDSVLPKKAGIVRIHVGGDMFSENYFLGWLHMAIRNPTVLFYAYTKSLKWWVEHTDKVNNLDNFVLTASRGGRDDHLIDQHNLREAVVVGYETEAERNKAIAAGVINPLPSAEGLGLEIDHDDSHAADMGKKHQSFALLVHGTQPAGSNAGKAVKALKGKGSYSR